MYSSIRFFLVSLFFLIGILPVLPQSGSEIIEWSEYPPIPDSIGFNGSFIGVHGDVLIVAGGANFPHKPVWEGGEKKWYDHIFVLESNLSGEYSWYTTDNLKLPRPTGYGISIETEDGLICIGGSNAEGINAEVFSLKWDPEKKSLAIKDLPDLPIPLAAMGGDMINNIIYVAGGQEEVSGPATRHFFALDLSRDGAQNYRWETLTPWPGPARINPVVIAQNNGQVDALYLFSGRDYQPYKALPHQLHSDVFMYNPKSGMWTQKEDIPSNDTPGIAGGFLGAAPAIKHGGSHILIFGGAGGPHQSLLARMRLQAEIDRLRKGLDGDSVGTINTITERENQLSELVKSTSFSDIVWAYHTITDTWVKAGLLPEPVQAVTSAVLFENQVVISGGEIGPGVRTIRVSRGTFLPYTADFGLANYLTLGAYLALIVWMGWFFSKRNTTSDDYFLGGKRVPWWAAGLSIYATMLSAITYLSQPALAFAFDWQAYLGYLGILMVAPVVIFFYLPYYRKLNITTAYEYLEIRFNLATRMFGSVSFVLFQLVRMGIVVYLPALALSTVIGMEIFTAIILMGVLAIIYTVLGGIEAVIWTDVLQVAVLILGLILGLIFVTIEIGDVSEIIQTAIQNNKLKMFDWRFSTTEVVTWSLFLGSIALNIAPYTADQAVVQRYLTTPTEHEARKSIWLSGIMAIPAGLLIFSMGTFLYVYFKGHPELLNIGMENDRIFPLFIANQLPAGVAGLVIAGIFSASMSSLDSSMHSVSTVITVDFYKRFTKETTDATCLSVARWVTVIVGILGTIVACIMALYPVTSLFFLFQEFVGLFGSALAGVFILGVFTNRTHGNGALTGAFISVMVLAYVKYWTQLNFYIYPLIGIPVCVVCGYVTSRFWPAKLTVIEDISLKTLKSK